MIQGLILSLLRYGLPYFKLLPHPGKDRIHAQSKPEGKHGERGKKITKQIVISQREIGGPGSSQKIQDEEAKSEKKRFSIGMVQPECPHYPQPEKGQTKLNHREGKIESQALKIGKANPGRSYGRLGGSKQVRDQSRNGMRISPVDSRGEAGTNGQVKIDRRSQKNKDDPQHQFFWCQKALGILRQIVPKESRRQGDDQKRMVGQGYTEYERK